MEGRIADDQVDTAIGHRGQVVIAAHVQGELVGGRGRGGRADRRGRLVDGDDGRLRVPARQLGGEDAAAAAQVHGGAHLGRHPFEEAEQEACAEVQLGSGEDAAVGTDPLVQLAVEAPRRKGQRAADGSAGDEDPRLLARQRGVDVAKTLAQDVVHRRRHVLHPTADQHGHVVRGAVGEDLGDFLEFGEALGRLDEDGARAAQRVHVQGGAAVAIRPALLRAEAAGVGGQRELGDQVVLMNADVGCAQREGAEGEGTVTVADHDDLARRRRGDRVRGRVQQQAVRGVDGDELGGLHIRFPTQREQHVMQTRLSDGMPVPGAGAGDGSAACLRS